MPTNAAAREIRFEKKFILGYEQALAMPSLLHTHPAHFRKAYPDRQVNNIYFDTTDFAHLRENVAGVSPRKKVRLRWYGDFEALSQTTLEIKTKEGEVVSKTGGLVASTLRKQAKLPAKIVQVKNQATSQQTNHFFLEQAGMYRAVLKNAYLRQYYVTADGLVRLTVDSKLRFDHTKRDQQQTPKQTLPHTIVELKYALEAEKLAAQISNFFPFRLSKSSKYVQGMSLCYPHLIIL